jgi:CTP:molybdopterin cytidylyltransferase MocA
MNRRWRSGMAASLQAGIAALGVSPGAALVLLCDQPGVTLSDLQRLVSGWRADSRCIAAARYGQVLGVPAIFPRRYWRDLMQLRGQRGARELIRAAAGVIAVDMPAASLDVDTVADLARLPAALKRRSRSGLPAGPRGV